MTAPAENALLARMEASQEAYAALIAELKAGRIDEDAFRQGAIKNGLIVSEQEVWIMDASAGRWLCYDGLSVRDPDAEQGAPPDG